MESERYNMLYMMKHSELVEWTMKIEKCCKLNICVLQQLKKKLQDLQNKNLILKQDVLILEILSELKI